MSESISKDEYGKAKVLGIDIQFSKILNDSIVENFLSQITEEDMKLLFEYITQDLFDYKRKSYDSDEMQKIVKQDWTSGNGWNSTTYKSLGTEVKERFNQRFKEELEKKIAEIIATDEYSKKIDEMAHEIIDYSVKGYKEDLKQSIREKMIGNVMGNSQSYGGEDLTYVIHQVVQSYFPHNNY